MGWLGSAIRLAFRTALAPLSGRDPMLGVCLAGIAAGVLVAFAFAKFTDHTAVRVLRRKMWADVLALRLFGDEPALAFGSLLLIARGNVLLLGHALPPLLIAAPAIALLILHLNEFFTKTPMQEGRHTVLTVSLRLPGNQSPPEVVLQPPAWVTIDAPPVHSLSGNEISWRLRTTAPGDGDCVISVDGERITKELDSRPAPGYFSKDRVDSFMGSLLHPAEARLPAGLVQRVSLSQAPASIGFPGLLMDWTAWFAIIASTTALLLNLLLRWR